MIWVPTYGSILLTNFCFVLAMPNEELSWGLTVKLRAIASSNAVVSALILLTQRRVPLSLAICSKLHVTFVRFLII
jgi:hypothetical protein